MKKWMMTLGFMFMSGVARAEDSAGSTVAGVPTAMLGIAFVVALLIAFFITGSMKAKLKTARQKDHATDYVRKDSLKLTIKSDHRR